MKRYADLLPTSWRSLLDPAGEGGFFTPPAMPFRPNASGFDPVNAWWLCELSRLIYIREEAETGSAGGGLIRNRILRIDAAGPRWPLPAHADAACVSR